MLKRLIKRLKKENLQKQLNEIISKIDLESINKYLVFDQFENFEVFPVITIIDSSDNDGISKDKAKELVNSYEEAQEFSKQLVKNILKTLDSLTDYQIRLSQKIGLNLPGMPNEYVRQTVKGDFEIRAFCKILL